MKVYYQDINALIIITSILYLIIFTYLNYRLSKKLLIDDNYNIYYIIIFNIIGFISIYLDYFLNIIPVFPDTKLYTKIISEGIKLKLAIKQSSNVIIGFNYLSIPIRVITFNNTFLFTIVNMILAQTAVFIYFKAWNIYNNKTSIIQQRIYLLLTLLYPALLLFRIIPLRECMFLLSFSFFILGVVKYYKYNVELEFLIGAITIILLRKQTIVFVLTVFLILIIMKSFKINKVSTYVFIVISMIVLNRALNFIGLKLSIKSLEKFRNDAIFRYQKVGSLYTFVNWSNNLRFSQDVILLFIQFIFAPLPIIVNYNLAEYKAVILEAIFISFIMFIFLSYLFYFLRKYFLWTLTALIFIFMASIFEYYFTASIRHRLAGVMMILLLVSERLVYIYNKLKKS